MSTAALIFAQRVSAILDGQYDTPEDALREIIRAREGYQRGDLFADCAAQIRRLTRQPGGRDVVLHWLRDAGSVSVLTDMPPDKLPELLQRLRGANP